MEQDCDDISTPGSVFKEISESSGSKENDFEISEDLDFEEDPKEGIEPDAVPEMQSNEFDSKDSDLSKDDNESTEHSLKEKDGIFAGKKSNEEDDNGDQNKINEKTPSSDVEGEIFSDNEGQVEDTEEGEVKDSSPIRDYACRFFQMGKCKWGSHCRFFHLSDKGLYHMFDVMPKEQTYPQPFRQNEFFLPGKFPIIQPTYQPEPQCKESAWDRALLQVKETIKRAREKKDEEYDFEEKKLFLSLPDDTNYSKSHKPNDSRQSPKKIVDSKLPHYKRGNEKVFSMREQRDKTEVKKNREKSPHEIKQYKKLNSCYQSEWRDPWRRSRTPTRARRSRSRSCSLSSLSSGSFSSKHSSSYSVLSSNVSYSSCDCSCTGSPQEKRRKYSKSKNGHHFKRCIHDSSSRRRSRCSSVSRSRSRSRKRSSSRSYDSRSSSSESASSLRFSSKTSSAYNSSKSSYPKPALHFSSFSNKFKSEQPSYRKVFRSKSRSVSQTRLTSPHKMSPSDKLSDRNSVDMSISPISDASLSCDEADNFCKDSTAYSKENHNTKSVSLKDKSSRIFCDSNNKNYVRKVTIASDDKTSIPKEKNVKETAFSHSGSTKKVSNREKNSAEVKTPKSTKPNNFSSLKAELLRFTSWGKKGDDEDDSNSDSDSGSKPLSKTSTNGSKNTGEPIVFTNPERPKITLNLQPKSDRKIKLSENNRKYTSSKKPEEFLKQTTSRREQLLKQLQAVEEAIARKKTV